MPTQLRWVLAAVLFVLPLGDVVAQATGTLEIRVFDSAGAPLHGATVVVSHEAVFVKSFSIKTDREGRAVFPVLRAGSGYEVTVTMAGMGGRREAGIRVPIGDGTVVRIHLADETTERVQAQAATPVIELGATASESKFSDAFVRDLPVPGRFYQNVLTLAPGVNDADGDGNPTVHGSRARDFKATVSGISNVDPLTGQYLSLVNADSIEEIQVLTSGAGVEFGRAQGGFARIVQKQGTNTVEGSLGLLFRSSALDGTGAHDLSAFPDPEFGEWHPSIQVSGPLVPDKLWYRLSSEVLAEEAPVNTVGSIVVQDKTQEIHAHQLTWQASPRNKLAFQWQSDPLEITNFGASSRISPDSTQAIDTGSTVYSLVWTAPFSPRLLVESTIAWQDFETRIGPSAPGAANTCVQGNPVYVHTLCWNEDTQQTSGAHNITHDSHSERFTVLSQATVYAGRRWGADHQFKFGLGVENERYFQDLEHRPRLTGRTAVVEVQNPDPPPETVFVNAFLVNATMGVPSRARARASGTNWQVYAEDRIRPSPNVMVTLGLRIDHEDIDAQGLQPLEPAAEQAAFFSALQEQLPLDAIMRRVFTGYGDIPSFAQELARAAGENEEAVAGAISNALRQSGFWAKARRPVNLQVRNTNVSPAVAVSWDPWRNGKTKLAASARRYYDKIVLAIPLLEAVPAQAGLLYTLQEARFVGEIGPGWEAIDSSDLHGGFSPHINVDAVDRGLSTPYQDEWRLLFEREVATETLLRVEYVNRRYRDQLQNVDINRTSGDFGRCRVDEGLGLGVLRSSPGIGLVVDAYTGERYQDTDPGDGDGIPDDCLGNFKLVATRPEVEPLLLHRPDGVPDLYIRNPGFGSINVVGNFNRADYDAVVLEIHRRQYRSWELYGSYTWSMATGNGEDFNQVLGLDPRLLDDEVGFQSNDQRHVVKLSATTITPWGFRIGGRATWQSGLPYSALREGITFDSVPPPYGFGDFGPARERITYPTGTRNDQRNDSQWLFDLKVTKELMLGGRANLQLSVEIFNVLNDGTYKIYNPDFGTGYQINGVNDARLEFGRRWQLGARLAF